MTTTQNLEPYRKDAVRPDESPPFFDREISTLVKPDVALHQTRGRTAQRQVLRGVARVLSIAAGDAVAAGVAALAIRQVTQLLSSSLSLGNITYPTIAEFSAAVVLALALTGNYHRSNHGRGAVHLFLGSVVGTLVVFWSELWGLRELGTMPIAAGLAGTTAGALFFTRTALVALTARILPEDSRLIPAILVVAEPRGESTLDPTSGYRVAGTLTLDWRQPESKSQDLARLIRRWRAEAVIVLGAVKKSQFALLLEVSQRAGCEVLCSPPGHQMAGVRVTLARRGPYELFQVGSPAFNWAQLASKRCVDVVGSIVAMILCAPICALIAIAIRLDSPGPVIFSQERVGLGGRRFRMLKFRTMRIGAEAEKAALRHLNATGDSRLFKIPNDPRVSRVGRFLRHWSIDELPQFFNVIMGHMSLVGPRPFFEDDFVDYEDHHFRRLGAKPGITGIWQVYGRSSVMDFEEVIRMDTKYIDEWSLWLDVKLLLVTIPTVLRRTGAY